MCLGGGPGWRFQFWQLAMGCFEAALGSTWAQQLPAWPSLQASRQLEAALRVFGTWEPGLRPNQWGAQLTNSPALCSHIA